MIRKLPHLDDVEISKLAHAANPGRISRLADFLFTL
jgi:hypothetical protein